MLQKPFFKILLVAILSSAFAAREAVYLKPADVDWEAILGPPPASGSDTEKSEIAKILEWQAKRTETDIARCKIEETADAFVFSDVIGDKFVQQDFPLTQKLLADVAADIKPITKLAKAKWERERPPLVDHRIKPCVTVEEKGSYPSAHSVRGVLWTQILAQLFPARKEKLLTRGKLMGEDRVISGIHFPSDVEAGQKLGQAIAEKLLKDPAFQTALAEAKAECDKSTVGK